MRSSLRRAAAIFAVLLVAAACGDTGDTESTPAATAATTTTRATTTQPPATSPPATAPATTPATVPATTVAATTTATTAAVVTTTTTPAASNGGGEQTAIDYLTFANGAVPVLVEGAAVEAGVDLEDGIAILDGSPQKTVLNQQQLETPSVAFVIELPALTTFSRFAVARQPETPSPSQTGIREIEILASTSSALDGFTPVARLSLQVGDPDEVDEVIPATPVTARWIKLILLSGQEAGATFFEFTELIGTGTQEEIPLQTLFNGIWNARFGLLQLRQDGATITGCYDNGKGPVTGTVRGNLAFATFYDATSGVPGAMIITTDINRSLLGVRSDNNGPFRMYTGPLAPTGTTTPCSEIPEPENPIGQALADQCEAVLHGITFDFDSAAIRPASEPILAQLLEALQAVPELDVLIEGHTSSEGSDEYNLGLSERRAQSVVDRMITGGIVAGRIAAVGKGETEPIADNGTEAGRSLNRRVEVSCAG